MKFALTTQNENYILNLLDTMVTQNTGAIKVDVIGRNELAVEAFKTKTPTIIVQLKNSNGDWVKANSIITMIHQRAYSRELTLNYNIAGNDTYTKGRISCVLLNSSEEYWIEFDIAEEPPTIELEEEKYVTVQEEEITRVGLNIIDYEGVENPIYITEFLNLSNTEYVSSSDSVEFTFGGEKYLLKTGDTNTYKDEKGNIIVGEAFFKNVLGLETLVRNKILVVSVKKTYDVEYKESDLTKKDRKIDLKDTDITMSIMTEPQNGPDNLYDDDFVSYCVLYVEDAFDPEYIQIDLKEVKSIDSVEMAFRNATERTTYVDIRVSEDGENFTTVLPMTGSSRFTNKMQEFNIGKNARYIRIYGYSNSFNLKWVSITELAVYASESEKSEKYYEIMKSLEEGPVIKSLETWETPYGTLVYYASVGVMHGTGSCLKLVRWDGTELGIVGNNAPKLNLYQNAPWSEVQLSEDGKKVTVIYKSNDWLKVDGEIEADLETGEVSNYKSYNTN